MVEEPTKTDVQEQNNEDKDKGKDKEVKLFTREELGAAVSAQIAQERKKWEESHQADIEKAKEDGRAEANMTAKQLAEKQAQDREAKAKKREEALDKRQKELDRRDHLAHTKELLADQGLPIDGAEMLLGKTEDDTKANIQRFKDLVSQGVRNELHKSSAGKAPQTGSPASEKAPKKDMAEMTYDEMKNYLDSQR